MYETVNVIEAEYTEMAIELAGNGVSTEEIFARVAMAKERKAILTESKQYRTKIKCGRNNRHYK